MIARIEMSDMLFMLIRMAYRQKMPILVYFHTKTCRCRQKNTTFAANLLKNLPQERT